MKYCLFILGCDMNYSDGERIASVLNDLGLEMTDNEKEADIIVAVACSVRQKAIDRIYGKVRNWRRLNPKPKLILTGCLLDGDREKLKKDFDLVFDIRDMDELHCYIVTLLHCQGLKNNNVAMWQCGNVKDYFQIRPFYQSSFSAFIPIMTGCDNFCSYCAVPYTRGREFSRSEEDILQEVRGLVNKGYKEITLLGQNVNSYRGEEGNFVDLLKRIDQIKGNYWVRFYANHPKDFSDELIYFLKDSCHFCHYIHLPLQSGDDKILKKMNRHYTTKQYLDLVKKIRKEVPDVTLATDVLVGFPGESEKQFENTKKVIKKANFDMVFISEYSERSGTATAKLEDDVPDEIKDKRKKFLNDEVLAKSALENNKKLVGKTIKVLIKSKNKDNILKGITAGLKDVRISVGNADLRSQHAVPGNFINVKIKKASNWGLEGELV